MHPTGGLCMVTFNHHRADLLDDLLCKFPDRPLEAGPADAALVLRLTNDPRAVYGGPIHMKGTEFQCRVWEAIRKIPPGQIVNYGRLASEVGRPKAVRAVAMACRANSLALVVPCHRVVALDSPGGFRWGTPVKMFLIGMELHHSDQSNPGLCGSLIPAAEWDSKVAERVATEGRHAEPGEDPGAAAPPI